jgi:hypothetical protein
MGMKKFLAIQVDGLSYRRLHDALHRESMPFLNSLLKKDYKTFRYNCGLPSNTPFAQAGIMYGKNDCIPGFYFVDKKLKKELKVRNPLNMLLVEHLYFDGRKGILTNGNSYANIFSGGARYSRMTSSQLFNTKSKMFLKQFDIFLAFTNIKFLSRLSYRTVVNFPLLTQYAYEKVASAFSTYKPPSDFKYQITRYFSSVLLEEVETSAIIKDMKKEVPYLYITFNGYDENSHHQGPTSPAAFDSLKTIDRKIERIFKHRADYDIYILSDHGHTESVPFKQLYGTSFHKFVHDTLKAYKHERKPHLFERIEKKMKATGIFMKPVSLAEKGIHRTWAHFFKSLFRQSSWNSHPYFLEVSDDVANLYFNFSDEKITVEEIDRRYPELLTTLSNHPGIGFVVGMNGDDVHVHSRYGTAIINKDNQPIFTGERFLKNFGDEKKLISQLSYFARMRNSGDLILFGDYSNGDVISFINHFGSHGSCGGEQMHPFFMSTKEHDFSQTTNVKDLYDVFIKYHE